MKTKDLSKIFSILGVLGLIYLPIAYTFHHRSTEQIGQYSAIIGTTFFLIFAAIFFLAGEYKQPPDDDASVDPITLAIFGSPIAGLMYYSFSVVIYDTFQYIYRISSPYTAIIVTASATLIFGLLLFIFRLYYRVLYGVSEIAIGVVVAVSRITTEGKDHLLNPELFIAVLTAGIYLIVRGLDNVHQGLKEKRRPTPSNNNQ